MKTLKIEKADNGYVLHYEDTTDGENKTFIATPDNINKQIGELCLKYLNNSYCGYQSVTLTIEEGY